MFKLNRVGSIFLLIQLIKESCSFRDYFGFVDIKGEVGFVNFSLIFLLSDEWWILKGQWVVKMIYCLISFSCVLISKDMSLKM